MNTKHSYNTLLYHIECVLEENKFLEYAFGINCPEMLVAFDKCLINIIAYKKILHCLETVKYQINGNKELQDEYLGRIGILKLKLEDKLNVELLRNENKLQKVKNVYLNLKSEKCTYEGFENNSTPFATKNYLEEFPHILKSNMKQEIIDYDKLDTKVINDRFKDELVELAEEMKHSAFRFQELLRREKKVLFYLENEQTVNSEKTQKSVQNMKKFINNSNISFLHTTILLLISIIFFSLTFIIIILT